MDTPHMEKYKQLGLNVSYYRKKRGLTQEKLAELIDVDRTHISNIEIARTGSSLDVIFDIADALDVPVCKLFESRD